MNRIKSYHNFLINEEFVSDFPYRVYKKTKDYYRIEQRVDNSWEEIETDKNIENLLLDNCFLYVNDDGRKQAVNGQFKSSRDVPVHAWIECRGYSIGDSIVNPDGILYYNPFTVKKFTDRESFESGMPLVIYKCDEIGIKGNYLEYKGATVKVKDMSVLVNKELVSESINYYDHGNMIYSPMINEDWYKYVDDPEYYKIEDEMERGTIEDSFPTSFEELDMFSTELYNEFLLKKYAVVVLSVGALTVIEKYSDGSRSIYRDSKSPDGYSRGGSSGITKNFYAMKVFDNPEDAFKLYDKMMNDPRNNPDY